MTENEAIKRVEEFGLHHAIGDLPYSTLTVKALEMAIKALEEIQQYRAIGTVEECRETRERQRGKKPVYRSIFTDGTRLPGCPVCFSRIDRGAFYCNGCGQKLNWSE